MSSKKKSAANKTFDVGDVVTHKMRGYPAWPGKIVSVDSLNRDVMKEKPRQGVFHCVRYYPKGDHSWASPRDLDMLEPAAIEAYISKSKSKNSEILTAYKTAQDPTEWEDEQQRKADAAAAHRNANHDEIDEDEPEKEEDELEEDGDEAAGDKRKAKAEKTPSSGKKVKVDKPKAEKKAKAPTPAKSKSTKVKSSANIESEDEDKPSTSNGTNGKVAAAPPPPPAAGPADDENSPSSLMVKDWRHKLQRAFLGKAPPTEKDMPNADHMFTTIENYEDMTITQLQVSKIGKVMRKIAGLAEIPREDEFQFKVRANKLMTKWQDKLNDSGATEDGGAPTNGKTEE